MIPSVLYNNWRTRFCIITLLLQQHWAESDSLHTPKFWVLTHSFILWGLMHSHKFLWQQTQVIMQGTNIQAVSTRARWSRSLSVNPYSSSSPLPCLRLFSYTAKISFNSMEQLCSAVCLVDSYILKETETRSQASRHELEKWHVAHLSFSCQWQ